MSFATMARRLHDVAQLGVATNADDWPAPRVSHAARILERIRRILSEPPVFGVSGELLSGSMFADPEPEHGMPGPLGIDVQEFGGALRLGELVATHLPRIVIQLTSLGIPPEIQGIGPGIQRATVQIHLVDAVDWESAAGPRTTRENAAETLAVTSIENMMALLLTTQNRCLSLPPPDGRALLSEAMQVQIATDYRLQSVALGDPDGGELVCGTLALNLEARWCLAGPQNLPQGVSDPGFKET